jgi:hypothetical protein
MEENQTETKDMGSILQKAQGDAEYTKDRREG